jgi:hypothetical protein
VKNYTVRIRQPMAIEDDNEIPVAYMNGGMSGSEQLRYARLFANAPGMLEMLRELEWDDSRITTNGVRFCCCCRQSESFGHNDDCKLAALFERIGDQQ